MNFSLNRKIENSRKSFKYGILQEPYPLFLPLNSNFYFSNKILNLLQSLSKLLIFYTLCHCEEYKVCSTTRYWKNQAFKIVFLPFSMKLFVCIFLSEHIKFQQEWNVNWCYAQAGLSFFKFNKQIKKNPNKNNWVSYFYLQNLVPIWGDQTKVSVSLFAMSHPSLNQCTQGDQKACSPDDCPDHEVYSSFSPGPWNNISIYFLEKPAAYLTLPNWGNTQTQPFWCDYERTQGLMRPSPKLRYSLWTPSCACLLKNYGVCWAKRKQVQFIFQQWQHTPRNPLENLWCPCQVYNLENLWSYMYSL